MGLILYLIISMILLTILWKISSTVRYFIKFALFIIVSGVAASAPIPLMLLRPRNYKNALLPAATLRSFCKLIGLTVSLEGHENIVRNSGCVVLINHQSILDLLVLCILWPSLDNSTVISKKEVLYLQPFGLASWLWGTIFIDRVKKEQAQAAVNRTGKYIRDRKARVLMFPEGTRNQSGRLLPFKKGAFHLAIASKCPIQPVVVNRYNFLGKYRLDEGHIRVKILPPISTDGYTRDNMTELMDKTYQIMSEHVDLLTREQNDTQKKLS